MTKDWIESVVVMQPMARKLEEQLNRREYAEAEQTAVEFAEIIQDIIRYCIRAQIVSGTGFK
jgi:maleate cis-trans isomerase